MSKPKIPPPPPTPSTPIEIDDATVAGARSEAMRRQKTKGYGATILTGVAQPQAAGAAATLKTLLGG